MLVALLTAGAGAVRALQLWPSPSAAGARDGYDLIADIDTWRCTRREQHAFTAHDLRPDADWDALPSQIDGWTGQDVEDPDPAVFEVLDPDYPRDADVTSCAPPAADR
jgi:hypothetical protein